MAFPPLWATSAFDAVLTCEYVMKKRALQHGVQLLPPTKCCAVAILEHAAPLYPRSNELSLPPRRRPQAEHQPAKRQPQRLHEWQDYAQQERHSNWTDLEIQVEETRKDLQPLPLQLLHFSPIRYAPKRKATGASAAGGKTPDTSRTAGAAAGTGHIFNIYKDVREDHTLLSYDAYPAWLLTLAQPEKSYGELAFTFLYGVGIENATLQEYMRFSRLHTKNLIKLNNMRLKKAKRSSVKPIYYDV